jgi:4a-hydroxytetrahydrobiopterin dehydratase
METSLKGHELNKKLETLSGWEVINDHQLSKTFKFKDFVSALAFVNKIGATAEAQNHHPDIFLSWGKVKVETWTHTAHGITEKDFTLARAVDSLL